MKSLRALLPPMTRLPSELPHVWEARPTKRLPRRLICRWCDEWSDTRVAPEARGGVCAARGVRQRVLRFQWGAEVLTLTVSSGEFGHTVEVGEFCIPLDRGVDAVDFAYGLAIGITQRDVLRSIPDPAPKPEEPGPNVLMFRRRDP